MTQRLSATRSRCAAAVVVLLSSHISFGLADAAAPDAGASGTCAAGSGDECGTAEAAAADDDASPPLGHLWPMKNGDLLRTGASSHAGPASLAAAAWIFDYPARTTSMVCQKPEEWSIVVGVGWTLVLIAMLFPGVSWCFRRCLPAGRAMSTGAAWRSCLGLSLLALPLCAVPLFTHSGDVANGCGVTYATPVIDSEGNIYTSHTGRLFALKPDGSQKWMTEVHEGKSAFQSVSTPALIGNSMYLTDGVGSALKLRLSTGEVIWRTEFSHQMGYDAPSPVVHEGLVMVVGFPLSEPAGDPQMGSGSHIFALDAADGRERWRHRLVDMAYNFMPAVAAAEGLLVVPDQKGAVYGLELATGAPRWRVPGNAWPSFTTGGGAAGPNGLFYVTSNVNGGTMYFYLPHRPQGALRAYEVGSGKLRWARTFDLEANNAPVVYFAGGRLLVLVGLGANALLPWPIVPVGGFWYPGQIAALDAATGETVWTFEPPPWRSQASAGSTILRMCLPDSWSNAAVAGDGTVYIGWHGGLLYALNGTSGAELSSHDLRMAIQGAPSIAPGRVVASSCNRLFAFGAPSGEVA